MTELDFAERIERAGGRAYVVGGWVRDAIRGMPPHDKDYLVAGVSEAAFESLFPGARRVGRHFPVYRLRMEGGYREVAFARREVKTGAGYRGFSVKYDSSVTIRDDLERRDATINSMAIPAGSESAPGLEHLIDPFGGARDVERRIIRATSGHFTDDPVRALRAARQSAQLGFSIEPGTIEMMSECLDELRYEPPERIMNELRLALDTVRPSVFFRALLESDLLEAAFPWLYPLDGDGAGDTFDRSMLALDRAAGISDRPEIRFAVLACSIGGENGPQTASPAYRLMEIFSRLEALVDWNSRMTLPGLWMKCAEFAVKEGAKALEISRPGEIADFLARLERNPIGVDGIAAVILSGAQELPPFLRDADEYYSAMRGVSGHSIPEGLAGPERSKWLRARRIESVTRVLQQGSPPCVTIPSRNMKHREEGSIHDLGADDGKDGRNDGFSVQGYLEHGD